MDMAVRTTSDARGIQSMMGRTRTDKLPADSVFDCFKLNCHIARAENTLCDTILPNNQLKTSAGETSFQSPVQNLPNQRS